MRVEQKTDHLRELLDRAAAGKLVPAAFQRPYVWQAEQVEALWTSILRGWPVGSFLIWTPSPDVDLAEVSRGRLGPLYPEALDRDLGIVLDGQNRLATLAWSLRDVDRPMPILSRMSRQEIETWDSGRTLVADPETRSVRFVPSAAARLGSRVPAGLLTDTTRLWPEIRRRDIPDEDTTWLMEEAAAGFSFAKVTYTILDRATPAQALEAFAHVARTGVAITDEEMTEALSWAIPGAPAP